jgi:hypothetical protein
MAADVSRYLAGEAVEACPPTIGYRLSKFIGRYKTQAAVASLFFLLLVTSSVVGWVLFVNARQAKDVALAKTVEAVEARQRAENAKREIQAQRDEVQTQKDLAEQNLRRAQTQEQKVA